VAEVPQHGRRARGPGLINAGRTDWLLQCSIIDARRCAGQTSRRGPCGNRGDEIAASAELVSLTRSFRATTDTIDVAANKPTEA